VFVVPTFDFDFLLFESDRFPERLAVLRDAGHQILGWFILQLFSISQTRSQRCSVGTH